MYTNKSKVKSVGIITKEGLGPALDVAVKLAKLLILAKMKVYSIKPLKNTKVIQVSNTNELKNIHPDIVVSIGGDGTLLRTLRNLNDHTPILCVNVGMRGILAEITPNDLTIAVKKLKTGNYFLDKRIRIKASINNIISSPSANEIFISRSEHIGTPYFTISIGKNKQMKARMDGLIISTPTGSTGHSYSFGGPVLLESLQSLIITPISPIPYIPSIVVPISQIEISVNQETNLVVDGQEVYKIKANNIINISKHEYDISLIRFNNSPLKQLDKIISS